MKILNNETGFTLIEMVVATLLTAILVVLVGGILWSGIQGFALGAGDYAASGELVLFGHYLQQDVGETPPGGVMVTEVGSPVKACPTGSGNNLGLTWDGNTHTASYYIQATDPTDLWRKVDNQSLVVVHHLDALADGGGVCFGLLPEAGEVQASVYLDVALYKGSPHQYAGTVTAFDAAAEGLQP